MTWDPKAERITARAEAEKARAEAERIRLHTAAETAQLAAETARQAREDADRRRMARKDQARRHRGELLGNVRARGHLVAAVAAIGSPGVLAFNAQLAWAKDVLSLGALSPLVPIAIEGATWYVAYLTHRAIAGRLPAGRYRAATWLLAGVAAGFNAWHGAAKGMDVAVAFGLFSLLGIVLWELTAGMKSHTASGRSAADIRRATWRRVRYPFRSLAAVSLRAATGLDAEQAWAQAWLDHCGLPPGTPRAMRAVARKALRRQARLARQAAGRGMLTVADGAIHWRLEPSAPQPTGSAAGCRPALTDDSGSPNAHPDLIGSYASGGIGECERWLSDQAIAHGTLRELPPPTTDERAQPSTSADRASERSATTNWPNGGRDERPKRRAAQRNRRDATRGVDERLEAVRVLLTERPGLNGAQIAEALGLPKSTARRLRARVLKERGQR